MFLYLWTSRAVSKLSFNMYLGILLTSAPSLPSKAGRSRIKEGMWILLVLTPVWVSALVWQSYCCKHWQEAFQPQKLVWSLFLLPGVLLMSSLPCCLRKVTPGAPTNLIVPWAENLNQQRLVCPSSLHRLPQLSGLVLAGQVQQSQHSLFKIPTQVSLQVLFHLLWGGLVQKLRWG